MENLLKQRDAALRLSLGVRTLEKLRVNGLGPKYIKLNKSVRYRQSEPRRVDRGAGGSINI